MLGAVNNDVCNACDGSVSEMREARGLEAFDFWRQLGVFFGCFFLNPCVVKWPNLLSLWDYWLGVFEKQGTGGTGQSAQTLQDNSESVLAAAADITNTDQVCSSVAETLFTDSGEVGLCSLQCVRDSLSRLDKSLRDSCGTAYLAVWTI